MVGSSDFGFRSSFGFRPSAFGFPPATLTLWISLTRFGPSRKTSTPSTTAAAPNLPTAWSHNAMLNPSRATAFSPAPNAIAASHKPFGPGTRAARIPPWRSNTSTSRPAVEGSATACRAVAVCSAFSPAVRVFGAGPEMTTGSPQKQESHTVLFFGPGWLSSRNRISRPANCERSAAPGSHTLESVCRSNTFSSPAHTRKVTPSLAPSCGVESRMALKKYNTIGVVLGSCTR